MVVDIEVDKLSNMVVDLEIDNLSQDGLHGSGQWTWRLTRCIRNIFVKNVYKNANEKLSTPSLRLQGQCRQQVLC